MQKLKLRRREFYILSFLFFLIFCINISICYKDFKILKSSTYSNIVAKVEKIYQKKSKKGKDYRLLKLKYKDISFFGVDWKNLVRLDSSSIISCKISTKKVSFFDYLKGFFTPIYDIKLLKSSKNATKEIMSTFVKNQHQNIITKKLFSALFFGEKIDKKIRQKIQLLGISHLVAISGFHLGVLAMILYIFFAPFYKYFQDRYFPYRNISYDFILLSSLLLFGYLYMVGFLPSLLRAYVMMIIGYIFYIRYIELLSFETLFLTICLLVGFYPSLLFSISFWFSISGVFYIFLFLKYFGHLKKWQIFIAINFWVYLLMMPIVHFIFPAFSFYQLYSPFLSILFIVFYPLELFLHIVKEGDLLDGVVLKLLSIEIKSLYFKTPLWFLIIYLFISLLAVYKKYFLYLLLVISILFFVSMILCVSISTF